MFVLELTHQQILVLLFNLTHLFEGVYIIIPQFTPKVLIFRNHTNSLLATEYKNGGRQTQDIFPLNPWLLRV